MHVCMYVFIYLLYIYEPITRMYVCMYVSGMNERMTGVCIEKEPRWLHIANADSCPP